jgi:NAD(P)-dependent dehydrogenase (short-subunit alcohol dehydrogenase family)
MKLRGKTALVTGGAVRIGKAICEALAEEGCNVVIHCSRSLSAAQQLAELIRARGVKAWVVREPIDSEADCRSLITASLKQAKQLDILVNNAAVFHKNRLVTTTERKLTAELGINLFAPIFLTRFFAEQTEQGAVINLLDRRIMANDPDCLPYSLSKKGLAAFTQEAALALAPTITVNAVAPGAVLPPPGKGAEYLQDHAGRIPLNCRISPQDVAAGVVALLRLEGVTGQTLFVDGGQHLLGNGV